MRAGSLLFGFGAATSMHLAAPAMLRARFTKALAALDAGDPEPLLASYADDAELHFHAGEHRWSGVWQGREGIRRFLETFAAANLRGHVREVAVSGPPWRMTVFARFDDRALDADGVEIYANRAVLVLTLRWGRIIRQDDFYADTAPILHFEQALQERGL